jgi:DNA-binding MurR/RpiR family transcriptional regulator
MRRVIETSGRSRYAIAKALSIDEATLCRFMKREGEEGRRGLRLDTIDSLGELFGLELVAAGTVPRRPAPSRPSRAAFARSEGRKG